MGGDPYLFTYLPIHLLTYLRIQLIHPFTHLPPLRRWLADLAGLVALLLCLGELHARGAVLEGAVLLMVRLALLGDIHGGVGEGMSRCKCRQEDNGSQ